MFVNYYGRVMKMIHIHFYTPLHL